MCDDEFNEFKGSKPPPNISQRSSRKHVKTIRTKSLEHEIQ